VHTRVRLCAVKISAAVSGLQAGQCAPMGSNRIKECKEHGNHKCARYHADIAPIRWHAAKEHGNHKCARYHHADIAPIRWHAAAHMRLYFFRRPFHSAPKQRVRYNSKLACPSHECVNAFRPLLWRVKFKIMRQ
jgi:hypothetical protein